MSKEALVKVSDFWMQLINDSLPKEYPSSVEKIIELNQGQMVKVLDKMQNNIWLMSLDTLEKFMSKEKYWSTQKRDYVRRIELLRCMLEFRKKGHIELLDLQKFRMIVDIKKLKCIFAKSHFMNLTVQENSYNSLLTLQGYFLKNFIYFHMRHDMRFKASIDSFMIEIDNPLTRQTIREENRKDEFLSKKYLSTDANGLNVENFCEHLLQNFFPKISGIWADHNQMAPGFILQFIRICLEYGLISSAKAKVYLDLLVKACVNLMKLEEGWVERPTESKKFSAKLKIYNVTNMFAKCREHISMILINILVLLKDEYFMEKYPAYIEMDATKQSIYSDLAEDFVMFNKPMNDAVLFITMNYLSNNAEIGDFKSTTDFSQQAVEKIFFFLTTTQNDCFLNSLKQITRKDLLYITKQGEDPIDHDLREMADVMGYTLRALLNCLGMGYFDSKYGLINTTTSTDEDFEKYLKKFTDKESTTLEAIFKKITADIRDKIKVREDYKVALVKESIPLRLVAFARYCSDYLEPNTYKHISKECFLLLAELCEDNNFCKAQLFKYESLIHLRKLLKTIDLDAFMLLFKICKEMNASVFLGKEVFNMFLDLYENFNSQILKTIDIKAPAESLNMENVATIIMMTKYMNMLFSRPFINENDKIQNMLLAQESMFVGIYQVYLPLLRDESTEQVLIEAPKKEGYLQNVDFLEGNEGILFEKVKELARYENSNGEIPDDKQLGVEKDPKYLKYSKLILVNHLAFWSLKLYNRFCSFGYSYKQYEFMLPFCKDLKFLMDTSLTKPENDWMLPIGLEAEILTFIGSFRVLPQQNILIENTLSNIQKVVGSSWLKEKSEIQQEIKAKNSELSSLQAKLKEHPENQEKIDEAKKKIESLREKLAEYTEDEKKLFINFIVRCQLYSDERKRSKEEAEIYLFEGLLPLLFSYLNSIHKLNLAESSKDGKLLLDQVSEIARTFINYLPHMNKIAGTQVSIDFSKNKLPDLPEIKENDADDITGTKVAPTNSIFVSSGTVEVEKLEAISLGYCELILDAIESLYDNSKFTSPGSIKKDLSKDDFVENSAGTKLEAKPKNLSQNDPETIKLNLKQRKLKYFIRAYQQAKETYLTREEEPNLIGFFDRNNQNLRGVFNSCLDRLLNRKKGERFSKKQPVAFNTPLGKFWTNRSVRGYVNMVAVLVSRSKTGRKELYEFIHDNGREEAKEDEEEDDQDEEEALLLKENFNKRKRDEGKDSSSGRIYREDILATLIRIHADLVFYLNSSSSRNDVWWVTHQTYEMISMFFKNLCECNFMKFKDYLAQQVPFLDDQNWAKVCAGKTYSGIFAMELKSIMKTTKIAVNRDPMMIRSDFHERVSEILNPLMEIINEATIGPCIDNQGIFLNTDTTSLSNIALRLVDDLASPFNRLASICLSVIIALMEGSDNTNQNNVSDRRGVYEKLSSKLPASILADRILRLTKKLYVKQLKLNGDYDDKVDEKQGKSFFSVLSFKKKSQSSSYSQLSATSDKPSIPPHSKNQIVPATSEMPLDRNMHKEIGEVVQEIVDQDMEDSVNITDWKDLLDMYMKNEEFYSSPIFEVAFRMMVLWKNLANISKIHSNRLKEIEYESASYFKKSSLFGSKDQKVKLNKTPSELACVYYFITKKIMCGIEILDPQQQSVLLYFPKLPATFMLAEEAKRKYREGCDIADSNTKMVDLMQNFDLFKIKMESSYQMADKLGVFYKMVSTDAYYYYTIFCWVIGFVLNIALLVGVSYVDNSDDYVATNSEHYLSILILGIILISISGLFLVLWLLTRFLQTYRTSQEEYIFDRALKRTDPLPIKAKIYIAVKMSFLDQPFAMSYSLHVLFTTLGLTVSPFFLTLNLLLIINFSKTTEFVLQAITLHIDQLALTLMLAIFVIYFYTLIVMDYFFDHISVDPGNTVCNHLSTCFFFVFNYGLRNGGGMAESLNDLDPTKKFPGRTIFDISFFMLINVISLNIIFGIIIDTFSQLRDAQNERISDFENNCFVCGNTRVEFSKKSKPFNYHILFDHDPWNYIYFIYYLKQKGEDELSGLEYHSWTGFIEKQTNWIPIGNTRFLDVEEEMQLNVLEEKINNLEKSLEEMDRISQKSIKRFKRVLDDIKGNPKRRSTINPSELPFSSDNRFSQA